MSATVASNTNRTNNDHPHESRSLFSSLPNDIVFSVLVRVPRRYHPILSCISKNYRSIVRSSVLHETRSLHGKDSFYVCFKEIHAPSLTYHWFTLIENRLVSISYPSPPESCSAALMIGPEIYFVGGYYNRCSRSMWILDSRSGKLREGPSMRVARYFTAVGLVDEKIYVFGGCEDADNEEIQAEVFDTKTQTWEIAPNPDVKIPKIWMSVVSPSLDRKIYVKSDAHVIVYDPRDGKCDEVRIPIDDHSNDVCVIDNVLYVYESYVGLKWYNSKEKEWRLVNGLKLDEYSASKVVAMAEYNGKLAFFRQRSWYKKKREIWCAMIALGRSGLEIKGKVEWFNRVVSVPYDYKIMHCLGRTD